MKCKDPDWVSRHPLSSDIQPGDRVNVLALIGVVERLPKIEILLINTRRIHTRGGKRGQAQPEQANVFAHHERLVSENNGLIAGAWPGQGNFDEFGARVFGEYIAGLLLVVIITG